jgi:hypothetical protein
MLLDEDIVSMQSPFPPDKTEKEPHKLVSLSEKGEHRAKNRATCGNTYRCAHATAGSTKYQNIEQNIRILCLKETVMKRFVLCLNKIR